MRRTKRKGALGCLFADVVEHSPGSLQGYWGSSGGSRADGRQQGGAVPATARGSGQQGGLQDRAEGGNTVTATAEGLGQQGRAESGAGTGANAASNAPLEGVEQGHAASLPQPTQPPIVLLPPPLQSPGSEQGTQAHSQNGPGSEGGAPQPDGAVGGGWGDTQAGEVMGDSLAETDARPPSPASQDPVTTSVQADAHPPLPASQGPLTSAQAVLADGQEQKEGQGHLAAPKPTSQDVFYYQVG